MRGVAATDGMDDALEVSPESREVTRRKAREAQGKYDAKAEDLINSFFPGSSTTLGETAKNGVTAEEANEANEAARDHEGVIKSVKLLSTKKLSRGLAEARVEVEAVERAEAAAAQLEEDMAKAGLEPPPRRAAPEEPKPEVNSKYAWKKTFVMWEREAEAKEKKEARQSVSVPKGFGSASSRGGDASLP